jgi:hypothetical protein
VFRRKSAIKTLTFSMSVFSRPWRSPAARSIPQICSVTSTEMLRSQPPSTASILEGPEDPKVELAAELLCRWGTLTMRAGGTSMLPGLWPGDLLTIQNATQSATPDELVAGDIVLIQRNNRFFVHRLVGWRAGQNCLLCITRGDAMPHDDPPATASQLLGRVAHIRRGHRSFVPSRRVPLFHSALAWIFCRWGRFRNLALRIHQIWHHSGEAEFYPEVFGAFRSTPNSLSRSSHS